MESTLPKETFRVGSPAPRHPEHRRASTIRLSQRSRVGGTYASPCRNQFQQAIDWFSRSSRRPCGFVPRSEDVGPSPMDPSEDDVDHQAYFDICFRYTVGRAPPRSAHHVDPRGCIRRRIPNPNPIGSCPHHGVDHCLPQSGTPIGKSIDHPVTQSRPGSRPSNAPATGTLVFTAGMRTMAQPWEHSSSDTMGP